MNAGAFNLVLSAVRWDVFGTLTYKDAPTTQESVAVHVRAWLLDVRQRLRLHENDFYYFVRIESGELHGRLHAHVLLRVPRAYRGLFVVPKGCRSWAVGSWWRGMTKFRPVEEGDSAVLYVEKDTNGADNYELTKTGRALHGEPSAALIRRYKLQQSAGFVGSVGDSVALHTGG